MDLVNSECSDFTLYHGTDLASAELIEREGFKPCVAPFELRMWYARTEEWRRPFWLDWDKEEQFCWFASSWERAMCYALLRTAFLRAQEGECFVAPGFFTSKFLKTGGPHVPDARGVVTSFSVEKSCIPANLREHNALSQVGDWVADGPLPVLGNPIGRLRIFPLEVEGVRVWREEVRA